MQVVSKPPNKLSRIDCDRQSILTNYISDEGSVLFEALFYP